MSSTIELEKDSLDERDISRGTPAVRVGIRISVNGESITGRPDRFLVSDFLAGFARKAAMAAEQLSEGTDAVISFNATTCDIEFTQAKGCNVSVIAMHHEGQPKFDSVSQPGIDVPIRDVIPELLRVSRLIYDQFRTFDEVADHSRVTEIGEQLEAAERTARSRGFID